MTTQNPFDYRRNRGQGPKSSFQLGNISIPVTLFSRVEKQAEGMSEAGITRVFITLIGRKYPNFLEAIEARGLTYPEAFFLLKAIHPSLAPKKVGKRRNKEAVAVAKVLCRKHAHKTPEEMVAAFLATIKSPTFETEVIAHIKAFEAKYKRNDLGKIRVREANPAMAARATKARKVRQEKRTAKP